jgi:hypothetical protein
MVGRRSTGRSPKRRGSRLWSRASRRYDAGDFFEAHELLEPAWMGTPDLSRTQPHPGADQGRGSRRACRPRQPRPASDGTCRAPESASRPGRPDRSLEWWSDIEAVVAAIDARLAGSIGAVGSDRDRMEETMSIGPGFASIDVAEAGAAAFGRPGCTAAGRCPRAARIRRSPRTRRGAACRCHSWRPGPGELPADGLDDRVPNRHVDLGGGPGSWHDLADRRRERRRRDGGLGTRRSAGQARHAGAREGDLPG